MRGNVVVDDAAAYGNWLQEQETFAQTMARAAPPMGLETDIALNVDQAVARTSPQD
jgi:heme/copper-type cytochrome/quinol oxidase subunit 2